MAYVTLYETRSLEGVLDRGDGARRSPCDISELCDRVNREKMCVFSHLETWETLSQEFLVVASVHDA